MFLPGDARKIVSPGARKEALRRRDWTGVRRPGAGSRYVELHAASAFSFLEGASEPEDLVERAAALGLPGVALVARNGVSGAPRFFKAAKGAGIRALVGGEVVLVGHLVPGEPRGGGFPRTPSRGKGRALSGSFRSPCRPAPPRLASPSSPGAAPATGASAAS